MPLQTDSNFLGTHGFNFDFDTCINVRSNKEGNDIDERVLAHKLVLSSASMQFRNLLAAGIQSDESMAKIDIDLREIPNSINAFKAMLSGLYTGELNFTLADHAEILAVARHCQVPTIENKLLATNPDSNPFITFLSQPEFSLLAPNSPWQTYLHTLLAIYMQPCLLASAFGSNVIQYQSTSSLQSTSTPQVDDTRVSTTDDLSSELAMSTEFSEKIVPNDDKEGWCRNKKYIEKVESGFMCTVCRKIYGRYNSVSYHVTIYHRNPPIRHECDETGCQFSTREARYIHFHKYYRHHIPLPDSIDLGSRKCPFCRHVSKSPAMLEKHIARHVPERKGKTIESYSCDQCLYSQYMFFLSAYKSQQTSNTSFQLLNRNFPMKEKKKSHSADQMTTQFVCSSHDQTFRAGHLNIFHSFCTRAFISRSLLSVPYYVSSSKFFSSR
ncbi:BTB/POZ domain protein [Dictyocaulus viviparus]|uniref:BTB/POZ domain protein n=1 Tax=Dictyocaulus viviparus TaxID=29172 RepID=A0A0D8XSG4_DICVI|nr:BTB/POZ domain protein [Dictyocaulus viviparus]